MPAFSRFLGYFVAAARQGSIRRASEQLHIAASAIDRQILMAEEELGAALFERLPTGLRLTAAGELVLHAAQSWQKDFTALKMQLADLHGLRRGHVQIAVIDALAKGFIPAITQRLRREHPFITATLLVLDNKDIPAAITEGAVDCGLLLNPQSSKDLAVRAHREFHLGFVCPPDHPIAAMQEIPFSQAAEHPIVAPATPLALCAPLHALQLATGVAMNVAAQANNIQMIKSLAREGVGLGLLCWLDAADEIARGELAFVPIARAQPYPLTLALCIDRSRQLSAASRLVLGWLETAITELKT